MNHDLPALSDYLKKNGIKLVTAESCTAGMLASMLADVPGCGSWLECAFVTYSPEAKCSVLGVKQDTIESCNLTSEAVAREMSEGALRISRANAAVANTGLAGPSNGDSDIPVGTVCFAWSFENNGQTTTFSETRRFDGDRNEVRKAAAEHAISRIRHYCDEVRAAPRG
jgi:PncC family amidohydrolase